MRFVVGPGYAIFEGPAGDSRPHVHAAFQLLIAPQGEVVLEDAAGLHRVAALLVPPLWRHRLHPASFLRTVFVEPHCALADMLRAQAAAGITPAPFARQWTDELVRAEGSRPSALLDRRLQQAMQLLAKDDAPISTIAPARPAHARDVRRDAAAGAAGAARSGAARDVDGDRSADGRHHGRLRHAVEAGCAHQPGQHAVGIGLRVLAPVGELDDAEGQASCGCAASRSRPPP